MRENSNKDRSIWAELDDICGRRNAERDAAAGVRLEVKYDAAADTRPEEEPAALRDRLIDTLIRDEKTRADRAKGPFHSEHEGWSVVREEVIEASNELNSLRICLDELDRCVRTDNFPADKRCAGEILFDTRRLIREAIQVGATAQRYLDMCARRDNGRDFSGAGRS